MTGVTPPTKLPARLSPGDRVAVLSPSSWPGSFDDLNQALRDPGIRAVIASRGGCGALRLIRGVDRHAPERDPKPLVGYSDLTALHQVWRSCGAPAVHGAVDGAHAEAGRLVGGALVQQPSPASESVADLARGARWWSP